MGFSGVHLLTLSPKQAEQLFFIPYIWRHTVEQVTHHCILLHMVSYKWLCTRGRHELSNSENVLSSLSVTKEEE